MDQLTETRKPDFVVVGAQKAGTTSLYRMLRQHPDIFIPDTKELHFFDGNPSDSSALDKYLANFISAKPTQKIGEITPSYLFLGYVPESMKALLGGNIKIVIFLRNPAKRAYSQFVFHKMHGYENGATFFDAIAGEGIDFDVRDYACWHTPPYYLSRSMYFHQVARFVDTFGAENVYVALFEDFFGVQFRDELIRLLEFLEVDSSFLPDSVHENASIVNLQSPLFRFARSGRMVKGLIDDNLYAIIRDFVFKLIRKKADKLDESTFMKLNREVFMDDIRSLENLLGRDLSCWYSQRS